MKIRKLFIIILSIIIINSYAYAESNTDNKYKIKYDSDLYFGKDEIVENDFFPDIPKKIQKEIIINFRKNKENINFINLNIKKEDLTKLFTNYYGKGKYYEKPKIKVSGFILENGNIKKIERFEGIIKPKGNFSLQSLKIGLSLNLEKSLKKGFFKNKDKLALRHLMYDVTGVNEKTYLNAYKDIYKDIFGFKPYYIKGKYYWILINGKIYGYYLVLDNTKEDFLKNNGNKKNKETCVIKSKIWNTKYRGDLTLSFGKNREYIMERDDMENIYKIEEGDKTYCLGEFRKLLKKIDNNDYKWIKENFYNVNEIYLWQKYLLETNNFGGIYQNFILIKHNGKWNLALWDGDLTLQDMNFSFKKEKLNNNGLINLILKNKKIIPKFYIKKIDNYDYKKIIKKELKKNYENNSTNIIFDRIIWFKYVKKNIWNRNKKFYYYTQNTKNIDFLRKTIKNVFDNIYSGKKYLN